MYLYMYLGFATLFGAAAAGFASAAALGASGLMGWRFFCDMCERTSLLTMPFGPEPFTSLKTLTRSRCIVILKMLIYWLI